jgi:hypothetical protein
VAQFATPDDLAARLGLTLTDEEYVRAGTLLELASGLIVDEAKQEIDIDTDVLTMPGTNDATILLPQRPVVSVESVKLAGAELVEGVAWYLDGNRLVRIPATILLGGLLEEEQFPGGGRGFGWPTQTLQITYQHGYLDVPASVKAICVEAVVRVWVNPGSVAQERVGDTSTMYDSSAPSGLLLTSTEQRVIRRFFGRTAKSITIGR